MTPQEQGNRIISPNHVLILDYQEMKRFDVSIETVIALFDRGIFLSENIYILRDKKTTMEDLIKLNE